MRKRGFTAAAMSVIMLGLGTMAATAATTVTGWAETTGLAGPLDIRESYLSDYDPETYESYGYTTLQTIGLGEEDAENYPQLAQALVGYSAERSEEMTTKFEFGVHDARSAKEEGFEYQASFEMKLMPRRMDEQVFSFLEYYTDYQGGAHGYYSYTGRNFDTATGEALALEQVITDEARFRQIVGEKLMEKYPDGSVGTLGNTLDDFGSGADQYAFNWVLGPQSMMVIFNPYEIASYAEGVLTVDIRYDAYPDLFARPFAAGEDEAYVFQCFDWMAENLDLDGDGTPEEITVSGDYSEYGDYESMTVKVGNQASTISDLYYFGAQPFMLHTADGRYYLYVLTSQENDYRQIQIFGFAGTSPYWVGTFSGGLGLRWDHETEETLWQIPTDPEHLILESRSDMLSTYTVQRTYRLGESGMPQPLEDHYTAFAYWPLTTIRDLPAEGLDAETGEPTGEDVLIPAGEELTIWRNNGADAVDLKCADGSCVRVKVENEGWPHLISGEEESAYFETLYYAG